MILGVTGIEELETVPQGEGVIMRWIDEHLESIADGALVTGACRGVDAFVGRHVSLLDHTITQHVFIPARTDRVDAWWQGRWMPFLQLHHVPDGNTFAEAMMNRNQAMVDFVRNSIYEPGSRSHDLYGHYPKQFVAFPRTATQLRRSGTWATIRRARKAGLHVDVVPLTRA